VNVPVTRQSPSRSKGNQVNIPEPDEWIEVTVGQSDIVVEWEGLRLFQLGGSGGLFGGHFKKAVTQANFGKPVVTLGRDLFSF